VTIVITTFVWYHNDVMTRKLVRTGNSDALILTKEMKEHLGVRETVAIYYADGQIILERPKSSRMSLDEAMKRSIEKYDDVYRKLAE